MPDNLERAREYRAREDKLRLQAVNAQFPELKEEFFQLAECYGRLASRLELDPPASDPDVFADGILGTA